MAIIGIDLGTTNSLAAVWKNGKSQLIPNAAGEFLTPSVVSVDEDGTILVGRTAKDRLITHRSATACCFKRTMGTDRIYRLGSHSFRAEDLSALVLRQLKADAENWLGEPVTEAVISVPAYFNEAQRSATKRAGQLAGLVVERLVNEPSAAAVSGHMGQQDEDQVTLVFDFGGGTLDVSLVERFDNVVSVTAVSGDNHLGGTDFDHAIACGFCEECGLVFDALSGPQKAALLRQAELCKIALTTQDCVIMAVENDEIKASQMINNEWMIRKCSSLFRRMVAPIRSVLRDAQISPDEIGELVMVGGSSHMPSVRQYITHTLGLTPAQNSHPDTAIALGVAICAGMKERVPELRQLVLTDVCPFTLGVNCYNPAVPDMDRMSPIIERNSILPTSKEGFYVTVSDNQQGLLFKVYQGENPYCKDNTYLGEVFIPVDPAPQGKQGAHVRFTYDINGLLEVEAVNQNKQAARILLKGQGMSEEEAEQRMNELASLKMHPRDQEVPRALIARAERMYALTLGPIRDAIQQRLDWYQMQLSSQESLRVAKASKQMEIFLNQLEGLVSEDPFPPEDDEMDGDEY